MDKRFLSFFLLPFLLGACEPAESSPKGYLLTVEDNFDFLASDIEGEYQAGQEVIFELEATRTNRPGALLNSQIEVEQTLVEGEDGYWFSFLMPAQPSLLQITSAGLFGHDCGLGHHVFGDGYMDSSREQTAWRCLNCGYRTFDEKVATNAYKFGILIENVGLVYEYGQDDVAALRLGEEYSLRINFPILDYDEDIDQDIIITADESLSVYHYYNVDSQFAVVYKLIPLTSGSAGIQIAFKDQTYDLAIQVADPSSDVLDKPSSIEDLEPYPEFKKTIDSLTYYEYDPSSFLGSSHGNEINGCSVESLYGIRNEESYDTSYLSYLSDSVYYPAYFPYVEDNPVSDYRFEILYDRVTTSSAGAEAKELACYSLYYHTIDADHSGAKDPFDSLSFTCVNLDYQPESPDFLEQLNNIRLDGTVVLYRTYPEYFFEYEVGERSLFLYRTSSSIGAIFEFGNYLYTIRASYVDR